MCGKPGKSRERRPDGFDTCDAGHKYKSKDAKPFPRTLQADLQKVADELNSPPPKHKYLCESMWRGATRMFTIRIWRQQPDLRNRKSDMCFNKVVRDLDDQWASLEDIAETLTAMTDVNAVEVVDRHGNGVVIYKDWP